MAARADRRHGALPPNLPLAPYRDCDFIESQGYRACDCGYPERMGTVTPTVQQQNAPCECGHFRGSHRELVGTCYDPQDVCPCAGFITALTARPRSSLGARKPPDSNE